jgi:hypothetical protein
MDFDQCWNKNFDKLKDYKKINDHCKVLKSDTNALNIVSLEFGLPTSIYCTRGASYDRAGTNLTMPTRAHKTMTKRQWVP